MDEITINADLRRMFKKHGKQAVMKQITKNNKEIPPVDKQRALFNYFRATYPSNVVVPTSTLRADALLGSTQEIKFVINESQGVGTAPLAPERRLSLNNTFEVVDVTIMLYTLPTTGGVPNVLPQTARMYTYNNPFVFASTGEAEALESIYNSGKLVYKLDNQVLYPAIDCRRFLRVPRSQEGQVTAVDAAGVIIGRIARDGYDNEEYPFAAFVPSVTLNGNGQNSFSVQLPESINLAPLPAANRNNYAALIIRGFEGIAGTQQKNRKFAV